MQITVKSPIKPDASTEAIFHHILGMRGYQTAKDQELFLKPDPPTLKSLLLATGINSFALAKLRSLLDAHLKAGDDICVFGDYDADGITATAVLWQALIAYAKGGKSRILPFLPDRVRHGYGLSVRAVEEILSGDAFKTTHFPDFSPKLVITVDNGIVAHPAVTALKEKGIDVVVTDHHTPLVQLPAANLIIHSTTTSGVGIAWILALSLLKENSFSYGLLDLTTIGVVADMMPLSGINRNIVVHGLAALSKSLRPGLRALYTEAGIINRPVSTYDINYVIAPRINAAGRLYDPYDALRLLCATNLASASSLAKKISEHNHDRQEITDRALASAGQESFGHKIIIVSGDYHEGVIGLVAGKLTEKFHKPSVVMSLKGEVVKASARSLTGINITELLRSLTTPFLSMGGHAGAAGFSLETKLLAAFTNELYSVADAVIPDELLEPKVVVDLSLSLTQVSLTLAHLLSELEPFGIGNPKPKFLFNDLVVLEDRELGRDGKHHKLVLQTSGKPLELLLFNSSNSHPIKQLSSLVASIDINVWREKESVQLTGSYVEV